MQVVPTKVPTAAVSPLLVSQAKLLRKLEARVGIEPTHKGFADLSLTTWVPRPWNGIDYVIVPVGSQPLTAAPWVGRADWSGRRDLNPRPSPWQGDALPLSYSRLVLAEYKGAAQFWSIPPDFAPLMVREKPAKENCYRLIMILLEAAFRGRFRRLRSPRRACGGCGRRSLRPRDYA